MWLYYVLGPTNFQHIAHLGPERPGGQTFIDLPKSPRSPDSADGPERPPRAHSLFNPLQVKQ